jgi:hypothetical protein
MAEPDLSALPRIRGTQLGLSNPRQVDTIKDDMLNWRYAYDDVRGRITGVVDRHGVYYVVTGHHRMVAALELLRQTGNSLFVRMLLVWGLWDKVTDPHNCNRPLPARHWWGWLRNRLNM